LIAFSAWTFLSLMYILYTDGIVFESNYYFENPFFDKIIFCFYLSKQHITSMQLCQFFILYINFYLYRPPIETWFNYYIIIFFVTYGVGVIGLFLSFYYKNYVMKIKV
jgi:hypothetical protein